MFSLENVQKALLISSENASQSMKHYVDCFHYLSDLLSRLDLQWKKKFKYELTWKSPSNTKLKQVDEKALTNDGLAREFNMNDLY